MMVDSRFKLVLVVWPAVLPVNVSDSWQKYFFFLCSEFCLRRSWPVGCSVLEAVQARLAQSS